jgi:hypothetical protein
VLRKRQICASIVKRVPANFSGFVHGSGRIRREGGDTLQIFVAPANRPRTQIPFAKANVNLSYDAKNQALGKNKALPYKKCLTSFMTLLQYRYPSSVNALTPNSKNMQKTFCTPHPLFAPNSNTCRNLNP